MHGFEDFIVECDRAPRLNELSEFFSTTAAGQTGMPIRPPKAAAGDAFPCHVLGQNRGTPPVHYAECFFNKDGAVQSISETLIGRGLAFAARDRAGWPIFPDYAKVEEDAHRKRVGIWANTYFVHPYGERHRANPSMK